MRILTIPADFPSPAQPTAGIFVLRQLQALVARGHETSVLRVVPHAPPLGRQKWKLYRSIPESYLYEGIPVRTLRAVVPPKMLALQVVRGQVAARIRREVARYRPDIIHVHTLIPPGLVAAGCGQAIVLTAHGSDAYVYPFQRPGLLRAAREAICAAHRLTAVSGYVGALVERFGGRDVRIIYNGADERLFHPAERIEARRKLGLDPERPLIVYAGNIARFKGIFDLAEAVGELQDVRPLLLIAGDGAEREAVRQRFDELQVEARLCGSVPHVELAKVLAAATVVALPSYGEGLPTVICEAMLSGRAVVATQVGGVPEIVKHEVSGLLVPPRRPPALAQALRFVITDVERRERFERNARAFALERLTWRHNALAYEKLFDELLALGGTKSKSSLGPRVAQSSP